MIQNITKNLEKQGIYIIEYENGKKYIGQSINIYRRALEHNYSNEYPCDKALKKYNATIKILELISDPQGLDEKEQYWIKYYDTFNKNKGYNLTFGGNASQQYGLNHPNSIFNKKELNEIINLLLNHSEYSYETIAKKYNASAATILAISKGYRYKQDNLSYPLRNNDHQSQKKNELLDYNLTEQSILKLKDDLLYRWDLTLEEDIKNKYNIPLRILRDINNGRKFQEYGIYEYPIRQKNIRNTYSFTQQDILQILSLLKNTSMSMSEIGKKFNIHRDTVSKINKGLSYIIKNYHYPAR